MSDYDPRHDAPAPRATAILGREPAAWVGLIEAVLAVLVVFALGVTSESAGLILAAISAAAGCYVAWATRDTALGVILALAKALVALGVYYGLTLSAEQTAVILGLVPVVVGFWQRTQTSPVADPVDPSPTQVVPGQVIDPTVSSSGVEYGEPA